MFTPRPWQPSSAALLSRARSSFWLNRLLLILSLALLLRFALPAPAQAQTATLLYVDKDAPGPTQDGAS